MGLTGDFARLAHLVDALTVQASGQLNRAILERTAPILAADIRRGFDTSRSPRNAKWRRLRSPRPRGRPNKGGPLYDSGDLRERASAVQIVPGGFVIVVALPYAARHQYGDARSGGQTRDDRGRFRSSGPGGIPARQYLPLAPTLPRAWQTRLNTAATELWRAVYLKV